jgi:hypothetical protein
MSRTTSAVAASTIGIDTGKHTLHLIGLDEQGMIVLREKLARRCAGAAADPARRRPQRFVAARASSSHGPGRPVCPVDCGLLTAVADLRGLTL